MSGYSKLPSEIETQASLVREFSSKVRKLKDLTSRGPSRGTASEISSEHDEAFSLSKQIISSFRKNPPNRNQRPQFNKLAGEFEDLLKQFDSINKNFVANQGKDLQEEEKKIKEEDPEMLKIKTVGHLDEIVLRERKETIDLIEKDITEVNSMFKEVSKMVQEQGVILEEAEKNTDVAVRETERAVENTNKANTYQRSAKDKLVVLCILIVIIVVVVILVVLGYFYF
jgi:SNARE domain